MFSRPATGNVLLIFATFTIGPACHAATHGPLVVFVSEQFGTSSRCTGASLGCQFATPIGACFTPTIPAASYASSGQAVAPVVRYLAGTAVVSAVFVLLTRESRDFDLETHEH